jgi:hypothetical protein
MRVVTTFLSALLVSTSLLLTGCGGGVVAVEGEVVVDPVPVQVDAFDLIMRVNTQQVAGVNVFPGEDQRVQLVAGSNFEIASSGPIAWTVLVDGYVVNAGEGSRIQSAGGAIIEPITITNARYKANTGRIGFLSAPVEVSLIATSLEDPSQQATIYIVLTN